MLTCLYYSGYVENYYYLRTVVSNTAHATLHGGSSSYNYCRSGHVYWYSTYSRCHVHDWLHSHGTICADVDVHGNTEQVGLNKSSWSNTNMYLAGIIIMIP